MYTKYTKMVLDVVVSSRSAVYDGVNRKYLNCILKLNVRVVTLENIYLMRNGGT